MSPDSLESVILVFHPRVPFMSTYRILMDVHMKFGYFNCAGGFRVYIVVRVHVPGRQALKQESGT